MDTLKDYSHQDLAQHDFSGVDLTGADMSYSNLQGANFAIAHLQDTDLAYSDMGGVNLGETQPFRCVAISPNGKLLATVAQSDNSIHIWEVESRREVQVLQGHQGSVNCIDFSPDGDLLVSGSDDTTVRLWSVEDGYSIEVLQAHEDTVICVAFSSDSRLFASGSSDKSVRVWGIRNKGGIYTLLQTLLQAHTDSVTAVAFSSDGRRLASGSDDKTVRLWNKSDGQLVGEFTQFFTAIKSLKFNSTDRRLLVLTKDFFVIDIRTGNVALSIPGHTKAVTSVVFNPNGHLLASASSDQTIRIWEVKSGKEVRVLQPSSPGSINSIIFSPDGRLLAGSGGYNQPVRLWEVESGKEVRILQPSSPTTITSIAFSPDGRLLAGSGDYNQPVRLWEVESGKEVRTLQSTSPGSITSIAFSPDGRLLAGNGGYNQPRQLWEVESGKEVRTLQSTSSGSITSIAFSPDGRLLAGSGGYNQPVRLWEVESGQEVRTLQSTSPGSITSIAFSPDGRLLAGSGGYNQPARLWEVESGKEVRTLQSTSPTAITRIAFSPNGRLLAGGCEHRSVHLWEVTSGKEIRVLHGRFQPNAMAVLSDDDHIALGSATGPIELWNLASLEKSATYQFHKDSISDLRFNPVRRQLVSASSDKSIGLLDVASGTSHLIRQELHCLRANIFKVKGLRDDQRALLLRKGAVEVDWAYLRKGKEPQSIRQWLRTQRMQMLSQQLLRREIDTPIVLVLGPATFLPSAKTLESTNYIRRLLDTLPSLHRRTINDPREIQKEIDELYIRLIEDPDYLLRVQSDISDHFDLPEKGRQRSKELQPALRENYNAFVQLVEEGLFDIVIDIDIFSQLDMNMFSSSFLETRYQNIRDLEYTLYRLTKEMSYIKKGRGLFLKYFSNELSEGFRHSKERDRNPYQLRKLFDELFESLTYQFSKTSTVIWAGFYPGNIYPQERMMKAVGEKELFWIMDESMRESASPQFKATYLDYSVGQFSDVFPDIQKELLFSERSQRISDRDFDAAEMLEIPSSGVPLIGSIPEDYDSVVRLRRLIASSIEKERALGAKELVSGIAANKLSSLSHNDIDLLLGKLKKDATSLVRLSLLRAILEDYERLPEAFTLLVNAFTKDSDDSIRAVIANWILVEYDEVGKEYDPVLRQMAQDKSEFVRQNIIDTITARFELLPRDIRLLASQIVDLQVPATIEVIKGSAMLVGEDNELVLRITNCTDTMLEQLNIELQPSAEYHILNSNPVCVTDLHTTCSQEVSFHLQMNIARQIAVNYKVNGKMQKEALYINAIKDNPYVYGDPIHEEVSFFGRKEELEQIIQAVTKPLKQDILIVGERRTGKTSLLYQLKMRLDRPFIPIYVVLNKSKPRTEDVLALILRSIVSHMVALNLLDDSWKMHRFPYPDFEDNVKDVIDAARRNLDDVKIVLLLDEADYFLQVGNLSSKIMKLFKKTPLVDERLQNILRAALQSEIGSRLRAVVSGTHDLSTYISQRSSPFFNHFRSVPLKFLSPDETEKLILTPASLLGYTYSPQVVKRIMHLSGGQPYYCQALCYEAFGEVLQSKHPIIGKQEMACAEKKIVGDLYNAYLSGFWRRANQIEREYLTRLAHNRPLHNATKSEVKRLLDWQIIAEVHGTYAFSAELFKIWTLLAS